jgi:hypothetical protein
VLVGLADFFTSLCFVEFSVFLVPLEDGLDSLFNFELIELLLIDVGLLGATDLIELSRLLQLRRAFRLLPINST